MYKFFKDDGFNFTTHIALGGTYYKGADVGEVLSTALRIKNGDNEGWYSEWYETAERVRSFAEESERKGHLVSARGAYLRASTYYNQAAFFLTGTSDPSRTIPTWKVHRECFDKAATLFDPPFEKIEIPYEDTKLAGYFFKCDDSGRRRPLLILNNGSDGSVTEMYLQGGAGALARGYNCLTFDGPGQGHALRMQNLYFRPDWEKVITPVVDYALSRTDVDPDRIALQGVSQAGYWVPRAVAFERRIAAAIADPGVIDVSASWKMHIPKGMLKLLDTGEKEKFDKKVSFAEHFSKSMRGELDFRMIPYGIGTDSLYDVMKLAEHYNLRDCVDRIGCPMLVTDPEGEQFWPGQSKELYDALQCPKELAKFSDEEGGYYHCEPVALGIRDQRIFDWLDETLEVGESG